jgi:hypothetical protein
MDIGRLFSQAWGLFVKDAGPLLVGSLIAGVIPAVAAGIIFVGIVGATFATGGIVSEGGATSVGAMGWVLLVVGSVLVVLVSLLLTAPLYAGLIMGVIRRVREGRTMGYGDAFEGFKLFGRVVGVSLLIGLIFLGVMFIPLVLAAAAAGLSSAALGVLAALTGVAAFVVMVFLYVRWAYVFPLIVDRGATSTGALRESGVTVGGSGWWTTFLALFVMSLAVGVVSGVLGIIPVIGSIASLLLTPFVLTYLVAMYFQATGEERLVGETLQRWPASLSWQAVPPPPGVAPYQSPPAPGAAAYPPVQAPPYAPPAPPSPTGGAAPDAAAAWRAAADPLPPTAAPEATDVPQPPDLPSAPPEPEAPAAPVAPVGPAS